ncbi:MAG: sulfur carrier protein ThiS [Acidobacteriaceae bacterium]|nr:sulfur carrier protein ThiS [Acidobacteriaceae bacterium]
MHPKLIPIRVNGEATDVPSDQSVEALLDFLKVPVDRVAVEMDKAIVRKRDWSNIIVTPGSQIEIVEFVGGG